MTQTTVILCTYNRCQVLRAALQSLAASELPDSIQWEVLVVDNNSTDQTRQVVEEFCRRYPGRFRYIFEPHPGKSFALNRGIQEAKGEVLTFTDDDVSVEPMWLQNLTASLHDGEWAGAGGRTLLAHPFSPPRWLTLAGPDNLGYVLAPLFDQGLQQCDLREAPYGANMAFRKSMFEKHGLFRIDLGPRPGDEIREEDVEFARRLLVAGDRLRYEPSAIVYHPIPEARVQKSYFLARFFDTGRAILRESTPRPDILGISRRCFTFFRLISTQLPVAILQWVLSPSRKHRFHQKCETWKTAGQIVESYRQWRSRRGDATLAKAFKELDSSCEVYGCDSFIRSGSFINRPILERLGIKVFYADQRQWSDIEVMPSPDWIVDCAANPSVLAGVDGSTSSRQLCDHNLIGTINLLEFAKARKAGFILISTSRVYSIAELSRFPVVADSTAYKADPKGNFPVGSSAAGIAEGFSTQPPISIYGASKLACEILALEYAASFDFPVWINRCGVLAGAGQFGKPDQGIFAFWINSYIQKRNLRYTGFNGTGFQVRDCLHPNDLARLALEQMRLRAAADKSSVINVSGGIENSMSLKELSDWLALRYGARSVAADSNTRLFDVPWLVLDSSQAQKEWGWRPEISIEKILDEICTHAEANPNWLDLTH